MATHNDAGRHWNGGHADRDCYTGMPRRVLEGIALRDSLDGGYLDVHAWQFTPATFFDILSERHRAGLIGLEPVRVHHTPRKALEFKAILRKTA
jgi:hypothetical protein